ncbi:MAG: sensor histidine kinase [Kiritimatiellota bacterium]|nr:sensor histidine kinase [Kiritimatiellota bacterium]
MMPVEDNILMNELEDVAESAGAMEALIQPDTPAGDSETSYLIFNLEQLLIPLANLLSLDACEVYLRSRKNGELEKVFHTGKLDNIWQLEGTGEGGIFYKLFVKGEARTFNLPNRRFSELSPVLQQKAYGQVASNPIFIDTIPAGMFSVAHTRRNLLNDNEQNFLRAIGSWIGGIIAFERRSQQLRTQIVTEERERIGMDLHDGIIQSLYGIGLSIENVRLKVEQGKTDTVKHIEKSLEALQSAIADIRAYILDLRPRQLRHSNLFDGIQSLIREFRANTMVEVELEGSAEEVRNLEGEQIDALYHIFQEALSNTAKHAKATKVAVRLWRSDDRLLLRISDNGQGIEQPKPGRRTGHGLANMKARAEGVGGGIEVVSIRKQGTTLLAWVPVRRGA